MLTYVQRWCLKDLSVFQKAKLKWQIFNVYLALKLLQYSTLGNQKQRQPSCSRPSAPSAGKAQHNLSQKLRHQSLPELLKFLWKNEVFWMWYLLYIFFSQKDIANKPPQKGGIAQSEIKKKKSSFNFHVYVTDFDVCKPREVTQKIPNYMLYILYMHCRVLQVHSSSAKSSDILYDTNCGPPPFWGRQHPRFVDACGWKEQQKRENFSPHKMVRSIIKKLQSWRGNWWVPDLLV